MTVSLEQKTTNSYNPVKAEAEARKQEENQFKVNLKPDFMEKLTDRLERGGRSAAIFGPVVERDGLTIIPVARIGWGFGGGQAKSKKAGASIGGGGGVSTVPAGFIQLRGGKATFKPIVDPIKLAGIVFGFNLLLVLAVLLLRKKQATGNPPKNSRR